MGTSALEDSKAIRVTTRRTARARLESAANGLATPLSSQRRLDCSTMRDATDHADACTRNTTRAKSIRLRMRCRQRLSAGGLKRVIMLSRQACTHNGPKHEQT